MADEPKEPQPPPLPPGDKPASTALPASAPPAAAAKPPDAKAPAPSAPAKPAAPGAPAAPPAKPPAPPPKPPVSLQTPLNNELTTRLRAKFGAAIVDAIEDRKQAIVTVERGRLREVALYLRDEEKFDMLTDLTAVDWPKREKRFDIVLNLYSFPKNERLRVKAHAGNEEKVPSMTGVWPTANWLEREVFDMFGVIFEGHPNLTRILLPEEWQGYPLRKDYDILQQDTAWVKENLGIESGQ